MDLLPSFVENQIVIARHDILGVSVCSWIWVLFIERHHILNFQYCIKIQTKSYF